MSTSIQMDENLKLYADIMESTTNQLIKLLAKNYKDGNLSIGKNITEKFHEKEVFFTLTDSEFENYFLTFKYKNLKYGYPYELILEARNADSPSELKVEVDENLINKLPSKMLKDLSKFMNENLGI